jgi:hypothetical protein
VAKERAMGQVTYALFTDPSDRMGPHCMTPPPSVTDH